MKIDRLENMKKGWFVGNFEPSLYKTEDVEVAIKRYKAGDHEDRHFHKIATEITIIISGEVEINKHRYKKGDMIVVEPSESVDFKAIADAITAVVKIPGALDDKYKG
jgi:quercetin dioxygenase-like cupin family protein